MQKDHILKELYWWLIRGEYLFYLAPKNQLIFRLIWRRDQEKRERERDKSRTKTALEGRYDWSSKVIRKIWQASTTRIRIKESREKYLRLRNSLSWRDLQFR